MKNFKKLIAIITVIALLVPTMSMAATSSSTATSIADGTVTVATTTYDGTAQTPVVTLVVNGVTLTQGTDFTVTGDGASVTTPGTYDITITGTGDYEGEIASSFTMNKATRTTVKIKTTYKTKKAKTFKKKAKTYKIKVTKVQGLAKNYTISYKVTKGSKYVKVNKNGKITIKKGAKKGTYKIKVSISATPCYKAYTKTITLKIK